MKSETFKLFAFLAILTAFIGPWRNSSPQDDAAWTFSILSLLDGGGLHHGVVAVGVLQMLFGLLSVWLLPFAPAISVLNFLTWAFFVGSVFLFYRITKIHWMIVATFFACPIWVQYGAIYHGEIYSSFLLILLMGFLLSSEKFGRLQIPIALVLSFLLGTQLQNMAAYPFFWGLLLVVRNPSQKWLGSALVFGSLLAISAVFLMPKSPFQSSYAYWMAQRWLDFGIAKSIAVYFPYLTQMFVSSGLFLLPVILIRKRSLRDWGVGALLHLLVFTAFNFSSMNPFSGGVLFLEYFPRTLGFIAMSAGIWGWWGIFPFRGVLRSKDQIPVLGSVIAWVAIWLFCCYRLTADIRYFMCWGIPILFHLRHHLKDGPDFLGGRPAFLAVVTVVSVLFNAYYLNTADARWKTATSFQEQGISPKEIAGSYGWNVFFVSHDCMVKAISKIEASASAEPFWKSQLFFERFLTLYGRTYEDDWIPRIVIKPSRVLGKNLDLMKYRLPGQDNEPIRFVDYSTFGIPSQLAVFENKEPRAAWCDR